MAQLGPLVSIVTPVYNGEKYLDECIASVRNQTYGNWEYVILNNCSTDNTPSIARRHAKEDARIRVIDNDILLPMIQNHNHAFRQIDQKSKYCKVVHADDFLLPACLELMVAVAEANPTAGIVGSYGLWGKRVVSDGLPFETTFLSGRELSRLTLLNRLYCFWSPSALLIRSDLIRQRDKFYNEAYLHADVEVCYEILKETDFAFVHRVLTFIRKHDESATSKAAKPYNKIELANLDLLTRYGPIFLDNTEYRIHLKNKINHYYDFLVPSMFQLRGKDFWTYQSDAFNNMGHRLKYSKLVYKALGAMIKAPRKSLLTLARSIKQVLAK